MRIIGACLNVVAGMYIGYVTAVKDVQAPALMGIMTAACLLAGFFLILKEEV